MSATLADKPDLSVPTEKRDVEKLMGESKTCPNCGNTIKAEAKLCRYCRVRFNVAVKGNCGIHGIVEADENDLCVKCGRPLVDRFVESKLIQDVAAAGVSATAQSAPPAATTPVQPAPSAVITPSPPSQPAAITPAPPAEMTPAPPPARTEAPRFEEIPVFRLVGEGANTRWTAWIVDAIVLCVPFSIWAIVNVMLMQLDYEKLRQVNSPQAAADSGSLVFLLMFPVISTLYTILMEGGFGATVGKRVCGLKVIRTDGSHYGYGRATIRALFGLLETNIIGVIIVWLSPRKQRLGDMAAGTLVVNTHRLLKLELRPDHALLTFHGGHRTEFARLSTAVVSRFLAIRTMRLEGTTRDGKPNLVVMPRISFPGRDMMDLVQAAFERYFGIPFVVKTEWWRLVFLIAALALLGAVLFWSLFIVQGGRVR